MCIYIYKYAYIYIYIYICPPAGWVVSWAPTLLDRGLTRPPGANVGCDSPQLSSGAGAWKPELSSAGVQIRDSCTVLREPGR